MEWILASIASLGAGFIDAIVGGGGLILVPALFAVYPAAAAPTLLGTNKATAVWGTGIAAGQYAKRVSLRWRILLPAAAGGFAGAFGGAYLATIVSGEFLRQLLPIVLVAVFVYTLANKDLGALHGPRFAGRTELIIAVSIGVAIGFYDGFFGPGAGSFFIFLFVRLLGYDFLNASAHSKILNLGTNLAALILFALTGHVWWHLAVPLAIANIIGALLGARIALKHGSKFVRWVFILVVGALIAKTAADAYL
ncbi:TSUP family transporter [Jonesiaceae bacterium BS-20]|uniref:Probable membrane transporter protein n=1 Tax=Jonesiaceae bacterium BS-20 TaxID=3120821 RepID=A0AAU7DSK0_9MICO